MSTLETNREWEQLRADLAAANARADAAEQRVQPYTVGDAVGLRSIGDMYVSALNRIGELESELKTPTGWSLVLEEKQRLLTAERAETARLSKRNEQLEHSRSVIANDLAELSRASTSKLAAEQTHAAQPAPAQATELTLTVPESDWADLTERVEAIRRELAEDSDCYRDYEFGDLVRFAILVHNVITDESPTVLLPAPGHLDGRWGPGQTPYVVAEPTTLQRISAIREERRRNACYSATQFFCALDEIIDEARAKGEL